MTGKRIVLVDDDVLIRTLVKEYLTAFGFQVAAFENGYDALSSMKGDQPDLVILDLQMPKINGIEILKSLRENHSTASLPVLMLSANADTASTMEGPKADRYLAKPFRMEEILEAVQSTQRAPS